MPAAASIMIRALCKTSARAMFSRKGVDTAANNSTTIAATARSTRLILRFMELSPLLQVTQLVAVALRAAAIDSRLGGSVAPTHNLDECGLACPENFERSSTWSLVNCTGFIDRKPTAPTTIATVAVEPFPSGASHPMGPIMY